MKHGEITDVNSKFILEKCGYKMIKDLGKDYYRKQNYCDKCVNKEKECYECMAQIWVKFKIETTSKI